MKKLFMPVLLLAAIGFHSCYDDILNDDQGGGVPLEPGSEVAFGVGLDAVQSRTVYGTEAKGLFPIYWKWSETEDSLDRIYILSPQGAAGKERAEYIVKPAGNAHKGPTSVVKTGEFGVVLGEAAVDPKFYGFYPSSAIIPASDVKGTDTYIYGAMPAVQGVYCDSVAVGGMYVAKHNMDYCFMMAANENATSQPVQLQFEPWSTVLDITLPGPEDANTEGSYTVTDVIVRSMGTAGKEPCIAGTFMYDFASRNDETGGITFKTIGTNSSNEPNHILTVNVYNSRGEKGLVLKKGETLNLKAFLLPVKDVAGIRVEVYSTGNKMWSCDLKKPDTRPNLLTPGSIHKVGLPNLGETAVKADYSSWITEMPDSMLVTEMSIPGSYESFSYAAKDTLDQMQTLDIAKQFEAGIRAFRARVIVKSGDDDRLKQGWSQYLAVTIDGTDEVMTLGDAIHTLHQEMQSRGNKEFCVLMLNQSNIVSTSVNLATEGRANRDYYAALKRYATYMADHDITVREADNNLKLEKYRGKIFLQGLLNANVPQDITRWFPGSVNAPLAPIFNICRWLCPQRDNYSALGNNMSKPGDKDFGPTSWYELDGAPMLLSWTVGISSTAPRVTPVTFGRVGSVNFNGITYENYTTLKQDVNTQGWKRPTLLNQGEIPGLAWMCGQTVFDQTSWQTSGFNDWSAGYKSNMYFDYSNLLNGMYSAWIEDNGKDDNYLWWMRTDTSWDARDGQLAFNVAERLWNGTGSWAVQAYSNLNKRVFFTTDIATNATASNSAWPQAKTKEGVNYYFLFNFLKYWVAQETQTNGGSSFGLTRSKYREETVHNQYKNMPFGVLFMSHIPDRDVDYTPKGGTDVCLEDKYGYLRAHRWHVQQAIQLLVDHSRRLSEVYNKQTN